MQKLQKKIYWAVILSESSHIFCCVLPTVFSLLAILTNFGMFVMPASFIGLHEAMHEWELPIVVTSGVVLGLGWALHWHSLTGQECPSGCRHHTDAAHPVVRKTHIILKIATVLFLINVFVFLFVHRGLDISPELPRAEQVKGHAH